MLGVDVVLGPLVALVVLVQPVHGVFENDHIRALLANDKSEEFLGRISPGIDAFTLTGPTLLALRPFKDNSEQTPATIAAHLGTPLTAQPVAFLPLDSF